MNGLGRFDGPVKIRRWGWLLIGLLLLLPVGQTARGAQQGGGPAAAAADAAPDGAEKRVAIDFNDVDINVFIKFISELTGKNFVVDNAVRGKVTIISPARISLDEAYRVFESVLEVNGFTSVKAGDVVKIVPAPAARSMNIQTLLEMEKAHPEDRVVTQLIPLKYADPEEIKRLFTPLVSKASVILGYAPANTVIITDVQSNVQRLMKILKQIDQPGTGQQISVVPLQHADAAKLVTLLTNLFKTTAPLARRWPRPTIRGSSWPTNAPTPIVMLASEVDALHVKQLIGMIDEDPARQRQNPRLLLRARHGRGSGQSAAGDPFPEGQRGIRRAGPGGRAEAAAARGPTAVVLGKVQINADKATNSLIIMADKEDYEVVEAVIRKLDIPRSMVYIESLIMEVNATKSFDLGVQWQLFDQTNVNNQGAAYGGKFSPSTGPVNPLSGAGHRVGRGRAHRALHLRRAHPLQRVGHHQCGQEPTTPSSILYTPQILTTDNEEARIAVGENRPLPDPHHHRRVKRHLQIV
ncbi:MAG: secretin N-terminal domain-containing protein [Desulfobacterales bacterium]|nr:secretin N-terminal domain-containing protein [Desulfobacterales bacterium]